MVLLWVKNLKQRSTRVTMEVVLPQFINLIPENQELYTSVFRHSSEIYFVQNLQQQHRVISAGLPKRLHDCAGPTCNVCSTMPTNFCLIPDTTE